MKSLIIFKVFVEALVFLFCLYSNHYAAEFISVSISLNFLSLLSILLLTLLPYFIIFFIVKKFSAPRSLIFFNKKNALFLNFMNNKFIPYALIILGLLSIVFCELYDVGKMARGLYSSPSLLKPLIVLTSRFDITILGLLIVFAYQKRFFTLLVLSEIVLLNSLRTSFSGIYLFFLYLLSRFRSNIYLYLTLFFILLLSAFNIYDPLISFLYKIRDESRGLANVTQNLYGLDLFFGKFLARLTSFSATAQLFERYNDFISEAKFIGFFEYFMNGIQYFWGSFKNVQIPTLQYHFTKVFDPSAGYQYSLSPGFIGIFIFSGFKSLWLLMLNLLLFLSFTIGIVYFSSFFIKNKANIETYSFLIITLDFSGALAYQSKIFYTLMLLYIFYIISLKVKKYNPLNFTG